MSELHVCQYCDGSEPCAADPDLDVNCEVDQVEKGRREEREAVILWLRNREEQLAEAATQAWRDGEDSSYITGLAHGFERAREAIQYGEHLIGDDSQIQHPLPQPICVIDTTAERESVWDEPNNMVTLSSTHPDRVLFFMWWAEGTRRDILIRVIYTALPTCGENDCHHVRWARTLATLQQLDVPVETVPLTSEDGVHACLNGHMVKYLGTDRSST